MSDRIGTLNYSVEEGYQKPYSEKTGRVIDEEVKKIVDESYQRCKTILNENRALIEK